MCNNGSNLLDIANNLNFNENNLLNLLLIWERNWNTYFEFGRLLSNNNDNILKRKWYWISKNHILARKQNINYNNYLLFNST